MFQVGQQSSRAEGWLPAELGVIHSVNAIVGIAGMTVLYAELRRIKEGIGPAGVASVFD